MWIPHSSFSPPHRPDADRRLQREWRCTARSRCCDSRSRRVEDIRSFRERCNSQTSPHVHAASGLTFRSTLPLGSSWCSTAFRFLRVGDCSRRKPVNQISNFSSAAEQRLDLAQDGSTGRDRCGSRFRTRLPARKRIAWRQDFDVQLPFPRHAVPICVGFRKVVAGIEKKHRDLRQTLAQQVAARSCLRLESCT